MISEQLVDIAALLLIQIIQVALVLQLHLGKLLLLRLVIAQAPDT
jgi:hypothetical protein